MRNIWIVTGPREVGKTRFCSNLVFRARELGMSIEGLICPPGYAGKEKVSISIEDLGSGKCDTLAKKRNGENEGLLTDRWVFKEKVVGWGDQVLSKVSFCDLLVIDELGPLEFHQGKGWQNGLRLIDHESFGTAVIVIRPELVASANLRWPEAKVLEIPPELDAETESKLHDMILI